MTTFLIIKTSTIDIMDVNDQKGIFWAGGSWTQWWEIFQDQNREIGDERSFGLRFFGFKLLVLVLTDETGTLGGAPTYTFINMDLDFQEINSVHRSSNFIHSTKLFD